ncbi:MAG: hypothetical protein AAFX81_19630 [Pseudomonadota bacterium]
MPPQPPPGAATAEVLAHLGPFVPSDTPGLPNNQLGLVATQVRTIALGHRRGTTYRAGQPVAAQTGLYLDATARFELWGASPDDVETSMSSVQANLLNAAPNLRAFGFLTLVAEAIEPSQHESAIPAWRKAGDFRFRYEFQTEASDNADSFIASIPIRSTLDDGTDEETHTVVDAMRRWDDDGASPMVLRGGRRGVSLTSLTAFDFRPGGFTGDAVTLRRSATNLAAPPTDYPTLAAFLSATGDPDAPDRNARLTFASIDDFLAEVPLAGATFPLGDWNTDGTLDQFAPHRLDFGQPIELASHRDLFTITYAQPAFAVSAILYLRVLTVPRNAG